MLRFATASEEDPPLGFSINPSVHFIEAISLLPTANTCINRLNIVIPSAGMELPEEQFLFKMFDYAFSNTYFGLE